MPIDTAPDDELLPATRRALNHRLAVAQADSRTPSVSAAVVRAGGGMVWSAGRGMSEGHDPGSDVQYRIGSISKTLVAVMVMRLRDAGLLDLADPLAKHLDVEQAAGVTVAQLLAHTAGLVSESAGAWWERTPGELRPELADILPARPQVHPAGRVFHYSNPGYALLGALVSKLRGGRPWGEVLHEEVLEPLGMTRTTLLPQSPHERGWAVHPWADVLQPEPAEDAGHMAPAAQYWSTAADMSRLAAFLLDGDPSVLAGQTLAEMRAPASGPIAEPWTGVYGLGIQLVTVNGRLLHGHSGSMPGFVATVLASAQDGLGSVVLANATSGTDVIGIGADMIAIVADREPNPPARWRPLPEVDQSLLELTGLWYWGPRGYLLRLLPDRGLRLSIVEGHGRGSRFKAEPDGTWTGLDGYYTGETLRLVRGPDGRVDHLDLGTFVFTREPYGPGSPLGAEPDPAGWQPGEPG
ncbi:MAG: serine hydrolase domain-containing protein [Streptosporangiaceae bacterium]